MIEIMNLRNTKPNKPYDFRVDRKSILGNPFVLNRINKRDYVCDKYQKYFDIYIQIKPNSTFVSTLQELLSTYQQYNKLRLFCWCAPLRCHGETIKKWLEEKK